MKKRIVALGLCAVMAVTLTACGADKSANKTAGAGEVETNTEGDLMASKMATTVELAEYKGVKVGRSVEDIDQTQVDTAIDNILSSFATKEEINEGKIEEGDVANIDYKGTLDGEVFEGGSASGFDLEIGSNSFIPGFESGLIGAAVGDTVTLDLTFPETYTNNTKVNGQEVSLAGKQVTFEVKINHKTVTKTPELTDEFVAQNGMSYGESKTVDELKEYVNSQMVLSNKLQKIWPVILDKSIVKIDPVEKSTKYADLYTYYENTVTSNYNTDLETYVQQYGSTMEEFEESLQKEAERQLRTQAVSNAIARAENITVTSAEYQEKADEDMEYYGYQSAEEYEAVYPKQEVIDSLIYYKVLEFIGENAEVVDDSEIETENETENETETESVTETE